MQVKLIPGPRDEEKIAILQNARNTLSEDEYYDFVSKLTYYDEENEAWFDALYYVSEYGDAAIKDQAEYFQWALFSEESDYFNERMFGVIDHPEKYK